MRNDMMNLLDAMKRANEGLVKVNNIIECETLDEVKDVLREKFGYRFFVKNRAYMSASDIGRDGLEIKDKGGYFRVVVVTYERRN